MPTDRNYRFRALGLQPSPVMTGPRRKAVTLPSLPFTVNAGSHAVAGPKSMPTDRGYGFRALGLQPSPGMTDDKVSLADHHMLEPGY